MIVVTGKCGDVFVRFVVVVVVVVVVVFVCLFVCFEPAYLLLLCCCFLFVWGGGYVPEIYDLFGCCLFFFLPLHFRCLSQIISTL